jgi:diacylglycerol kinase family enzyme
MRALLIVNPHATSTTPLRRDVIVSALASEFDLEVVETRYRGHAVALAAGAVKERRDLVITLGGDGTVHEAVNGLVHGPDGQAPAAADDLPALAPVPGTGRGPDRCDRPDSGRHFRAAHPVHRARHDR